MHVIGEIDGRNCVIMDDMIDTAGTLVKAAEVLKERGAKQRLRLLHARRCSPARRSSASASRSSTRSSSPTRSRSATDGKSCKKIRQLSVAFLFAETIRRISDGESVTSLFAEQNRNF